ncbi:hypothetical protein [Altererythrobacter sp. ZODW24]|uniref:hypothetical protein n=1 Tax=Altererythrobacter sp. ZODW24 TaxID=2185142 RepID=UPI000DF80F02|nr:hypothetical protein [Altererythrobacter sp. ZODW24]
MSGGFHHYRHSGLSVASELELPEWAAFASENSADPDVTIRIDVSVEPTGLSPHEPQIIGDRLVFDDEDAGTYAAVAGKELLIAPKAGVSERELRLFALGSGWGAIGHQRGLQLLHGSAVMGPQGAVLLAGEAGAGKSTFAAAMTSRGHSLVADDLSRVELADSGARIWPSSSRVKLWDDALESLGWSEREMEQDHFRDRKFHLPVETAIGTDPVPLAACYILEWGDFETTRLTGGEAVGALLQATMYRISFLRALGTLGAYTGQVARLAAVMPVYRLTRPKDATLLGESCAMLEKHWQA